LYLCSYNLDGSVTLPTVMGGHGLNSTVPTQLQNWSSVGQGSGWDEVGWLAGFTAKRHARRIEPRWLHHAEMTVRVRRPWWQRREERSALGSPRAWRDASGQRKRVLRPSTVAATRRARKRRRQRHQAGTDSDAELTQAAAGRRRDTS
jgi:hypothetical protein